MARLPKEAISGEMKKLCWYQAEQLSKLADERINHIERGSKNDPVVWLDRLAAIFRHTNPIVENHETHPCQSAINDVRK